MLIDLSGEALSNQDGGTPVGPSRPWDFFMVSLSEDGAMHGEETYPCTPAREEAADLESVVRLAENQPVTAGDLRMETAPCTPLA